MQPIILAPFNFIRTIGGLLSPYFFSSAPHPNRGEALHRVDKIASTVLHQPVSPLTSREGKRATSFQEKFDRCGCPTLDPRKNPKPWNFYEKLVKHIFNSKIEKKPKEMSLALFSSGYLCQDCNLIRDIFDLIKLNKWSGALHLQLVGLNYKMEDVELLNDQLNIFFFDIKKTSEFMFNFLGDIWHVLKQQEIEEQARKTFGPGFRDLFPQKEEQTVERNKGVEDYIERFVGQFSQKGDNSSSDPMPEGSVKPRFSPSFISQTFDSERDKKTVHFMLNFLKKFDQEGYREVNLIPSFFSNAKELLEEKEGLDAMFGYDIENHLGDFQELQRLKLKENGKIAAFIKKMHRIGQKVEYLPFLLQADGKAPLTPTEF